MGKKSSTESSTISSKSPTFVGEMAIPVDETADVLSQSLHSFPELTVHTPYPRVSKEST